MLRFLAIRHLAVIDQLELEFQPGLNVLTGETGAGKSILVGAVGLLVGGRASADIVRTGEDTATIEAIFDTPDGRELIVRREVTAQGRSRAYVDGALVTSAALRDAAGRLVDLHGQHEHQVLLDPTTHVDLLDAYAGLSAARTEVADAYRGWQQIRDERLRLAAAQRETAARREFVEFQLNEIRKGALKPGEDEELAAARTVLANADKLQRLCGDAYQALYEGDNAALTALGTVWRRIGELAAIDEKFAPYVAARDVVKPQLEDLAYFLRSYAGGIDASPARLQEVEDRLAVLERLKKKHGPTLAQVIAKGEQLSRDLEAVDNASDRMAQIDRDLNRAREAYLAACGKLTEQRKPAAERFSRALAGSLGDLAMARTRCEVRFSTAADESQWSERGVDSGEFYISPNPGEDLKPLARIASGGELSRIMLALKTLASTDAPGKTLIFDEVDTGIGGAVADVVGSRLSRLAESFQVLCITHLPQIAAHGSSHFSIAKSVKSGRTVTRVTRLDPREREEELARMIGGSDISVAVRAGARDLLASRGGAKGETKAKGESESPRRRK
jgi:DNA repair protein RecN (Recombination protein N)